MSALGCQVTTSSEVLKQSFIRRVKRCFYRKGQDS